MNALWRRSRGPRGVVASGIVAAGPLVVLLACAGAEAAAIHHQSADAELTPVKGMPASEASVFKEWSQYLLAGPSAWAKVEHPPVTAAVRSAIWTSVKTDPGGTDPMVSFLLWKQSIDPTRFAYYHPKLAPALHRIALSRTSPTLVPTVGPSTSSSGGGTPATSTPPTSSPQNLLPPAAPEPSTLLIAAGMTAWLVRRTLRRPPAGGE